MVPHVLSNSGEVGGDWNIETLQGFLRFNAPADRTTTFAVDRAYVRSPDTTSIPVAVLLELKITRLVSACVYTVSVVSVIARSR